MSSDKSKEEVVLRGISEAAGLILSCLVDVAQESKASPMQSKAYLLLRSILPTKALEKICKEALAKKSKGRDDYEEIPNMNAVKDLLLDDSKLLAVCYTLNFTFTRLQSRSNYRMFFSNAPSECDPKSCIQVVSQLVDTSVAAIVAANSPANSSPGSPYLMPPVANMNCLPSLATNTENVRRARPQDGKSSVNLAPASFLRGGNGEPKGAKLFPFGSKETSFHPKTFANLSEQNILTMSAMQKRILQMRHAHHCKFAEGACQILPNNCSFLRALYRHVLQCSGVCSCNVRYCRGTRKALLHYQSCELAMCPICVPVKIMVSKEYDQAKQHKLKFCQEVSKAPIAGAKRNVVTPESLEHTEAPRKKASVSKNNSTAK